MSFTLEAAERLRIAGHFVRQEFQPNKTVQPGVLSLIDHTHPAATEFFDNAVMRNCLFDHRRESYVGDMGKSMKVGRLDRP